MIPWYYVMKKNRYFTSWSQFLQALEFAYGHSAYEDPSYALICLMMALLLNIIIPSLCWQIEWMECRPKHY